MLSLIACLAATICFALLLRTPARVLPVVGLIAMAGYGVFLLSGPRLAGYFASALLIAALSEVAARLLRMMSTQFIVCGLIPIVPGLVLYRAVVFLAEKDFVNAGAQALEALGGFGAIALAITFSTAIFNNFHPFHLRLKRRKPSA